MNNYYPLNSIMFLLIPRLKILAGADNETFKFHYVSINSEIASEIITQASNFKFHYVSINSRPKTNRLFTPQNTSILSTSPRYIIFLSLFIIYFSSTSYFSHFLLLSIPCVFYTITDRQKSLNFYHIKLTLYYESNQANIQP